MNTPSPKPEDKQPKAPEIDAIRREVSRAARQLEGLSKSLKRLDERMKGATA